jgi:hypothetical protein
MTGRHPSPIDCISELRDQLAVSQFKLAACITEIFQGGRGAPRETEGQWSAKTSAGPSDERRMPRSNIVTYQFAIKPQVADSKVDLSTSFCGPQGLPG